MKIAIFGWYGHDNAGDERIKYCLNHFLMNLGGVNCVNFYDLHTNAIKGKTKQFDRYDLVIIGGGGLIYSQANYHDFILGIGTALITLGVSVETELKGNPRKFALALLESSQFVVVRDAKSYELLASLRQDKNIMISPDLTFLEPYPALSKCVDEDVLGINLFAKTKFSTNHFLFYYFQSIINRLNINIPIYDFHKMIASLRLKYSFLPIPLYSPKQDENLRDYKLNDVNMLKKYFEDVPCQFKADDIDRCSMFISMRLHGLIFAVQKGIIPIAFNVYPKQVNFMSEYGMNNNILDINNLNNINYFIEEVNKKQSALRNNIVFLSQNSVLEIRKDLLFVMNHIKKKL